MAALYKEYQKDVDDILAGAKSPQEGLLTKTDRKCYRAAKQLVAKEVAEPAAFKEVTEGASQLFRASEITAVRWIIDLAAKSAAKKDPSTT